MEDWKKALDENLCIGAILMDLSKAFDCLPHDLIIEKLKAYGLRNSPVSSCIVTCQVENKDLN